MGWQAWLSWDCPAPGQASQGVLLGLSSWPPGHQSVLFRGRIHLWPLHMCSLCPGRKLLVSTAAGEEGIDVPSCDLVVRYTATQTGGQGGARPSCSWQV